MASATLTELIAALEPGERATRKAELLATLLRDGSYTVGNKTVSLTKFSTFARDGVTISVESVSHEAGVFYLTLSASDANGALPTAPRYGFRNPPLMKWVRDPVMDGETVIDPGEAQESLVEVVQGFVYDAVIAYARGQGWGG